MDIKFNPVDSKQYLIFFLQQFLFIRFSLELLLQDSKMRSWRMLLLLLLIWCAAGAIGQRPTLNKRHDVYIAGFFPFGDRVPGSIPEGQVGRGVMPAVKLAVDHINESPNLLRNYRLHVWWNDTEVSPNKFLS